MAGHVLLYGGGPVCYRAKRVPLTTLSVCETEYVQATLTVVEILATRGKLAFMGHPTIKVDPTMLFCDNKAAVQLSDNNTSSKRMKHIATRIAFLRETVQRKEVLLHHIQTEGQVADIMTKALGAHLFHALRKLLLRA